MKKGIQHSDYRKKGFYIGKIKFFFEIVHKKYDKPLNLDNKNLNFNKNIKGIILINLLLLILF